MVSLDGFIESTNREIDWVIIDEELHRFANDQEKALGVFLYGRRLYEIMTDYWPTADSDPSNPDYIIEYAHIWKSMPKIVFSKTLTRVQGNASLAADNPVRVLDQLKQQPGKDISVGGATLAATFIRLGLIDEYQLFIHPLVLGSGTPMFPLWDVKTNLKLVETRIFQSGVVFLRYQPVK